MQSKAGKSNARRAGGGGNDNDNNPHNNTLRTSKNINRAPAGLVLLTFLALGLLLALCLVKLASVSKRRADVPSQQNSDPSELAFRPRAVGTSGIPSSGGHFASPASASIGQALAEVMPATMPAADSGNTGLNKDRSSAGGHPAENENSGDSITTFDEAYDSIAVVVVGGRERADHLAAAYTSWTSVFKNRIFITDAPAKDHGGPRGMSKILTNVYAWHASDADALKAHTHPDHPIREYLDHPEDLANVWNKNMDSVTRELFNPDHSISWHLGQPKYLLGLAEAYQTYPDAKWYVIADSDTIMFPERLVAGLHLFGRNDEKAVAIGATTRAVKSEALPKFTSYLGGAGVVINQAAMQKMNISDCVAQQVGDLGWSTAPADWRLGLCFKRYKVRAEDQKYMYQSNEELNCKPHSPLKTCSWAGRYGRTMSDCPLSLHYQTPEHMEELFAARSTKDQGGVCIPSKHWRDFTSDCDCFSTAQAFEKSKESNPPSMVLPGGAAPSESDAVNAAIVETARMVGGGANEQQGQHFHNHVKTAVENLFRVQLFPLRKDVAAVADATVDVIQNWGGGKTNQADSLAFRKAVAKALLANVARWHPPSRVLEWAKEQA